jgi:hypothetical protein
MRNFNLNKGAVIAFAALIVVAGLFCSCERKADNQESELEISEKFIPYFSIENGRYVLDLTVAQAERIGIDEAHYTPVKETIDSFNSCIDEYQITEEELESGDPIHRVDKDGKPIEIHLITSKDIDSMRSRVGLSPLKK